MSFKKLHRLLASGKTKVSFEIKKALTVDEWKQIAEAIRNHSGLQSLCLVNVDNEGVKAIAEGLAPQDVNNTTTLYDGKRSEELRAHCSCTTLQTLELDCATVNIDGAIALGNIITQCPTLEILNLNSLTLPENASHFIAEAIERDTKLRVIGLRNTRELALSVVDALARHPAITGLELSQNLLGSEGCIAVAGLLEQNHRVVAVQMDDNNIDDYGMECLGAGFYNRRPPMKMLSLKGNNAITLAGAMTITNLISRSTNPEAIANLIEQFFDTQCIEKFPTHLPIVCEGMTRGQIPTDPSLQTKAHVENFMNEVLRVLARLERFKLPRPQPTDSVGASCSLLLSPSLLFSPAKQPTAATNRDNHPPSTRISNDLSGGTESDEEIEIKCTRAPKRRLCDINSGTYTNSLFGMTQSDDGDEQTSQSKCAKTETYSLSS